jgi:hypothetical protein
MIREGNPKSGSVGSVGSVGSAGLLPAVRDARIREEAAHGRLALARHLKMVFHRRYQEYSELVDKLEGKTPL